MLRQPLAIAALLTTGWTAILVVYFQGFIVTYYPMADEWSLLANSHPAFATPREWFTRGFSDYFVPPLGSNAQYIRPAFNFSYWLLGQVLSPYSGAYLYLNYLLVGLCSGLLYLCLVDSSKPGLQTIPLVFSGLLPWMSAWLPTTGMLLTPCLAFDPLAASLCLAAFLAYRKRNLWTASLLLLAAVFTKETALPIAFVLPAHYLLTNRRGFWAARHHTIQLFALCLPLLIWLIVRAIMFGSSTDNVDVLSTGAAELIKRSIRLATIWPFGGSGQLAVVWPITEHVDWPRALALLANVTVMGVAVCAATYRLIRKQMPSVGELCAMGCYAFILLVGVAPRYGAVAQAFFLICFAGWMVMPDLKKFRPILVAGIGVGMLAANLQTIPQLDRNLDLLTRYHHIARNYAETLKKYSDGQTVLVLNDPVTMNSKLGSLTHIIGATADIDKLADFACPATAYRLDNDCNVTLTELPQKRHYLLTQSCGIDHCGLKERHHGHSNSTITHLSKEQSPSVPAAVDWDTYQIGADRLQFRLKQGDVYLLYFQPESLTFKAHYVP